MLYGNALGVGNGEWGMGNGEWGMGNGEWGMGNGEGIILVDRFSGINVDPVSPHRKVKQKRMKPCDATRQYEPNINTEPQTLTFVYGHITLKTPVLVRSPKLSNVEPG